MLSTGDNHSEQNSLSPQEAILSLVELISVECNGCCEGRQTWIQDETDIGGEALQTAMKRREAKGKGEKERYTHLNAEFQRIQKEIRKLF